MNSFVNAVKNQDARTTNGMKALATSSDSIVDLFYKIGASRGKDIIPDFIAAYQQDKSLALRVALWARDVRGGAGERQLFRNILQWLEKNDKDALIKVLEKTPLVGRWDDIQVVSESDMKVIIFNMIKTALDNKDGLAAKWTPRKGSFAAQFREFLGWSPKRYRKTLVELTKVVEQQMCAKQWNEINYSHVPSVASKRYRKAFFKNDKERFEGYVNALVKGEKFEGKEVKINASAIFPHDVIRGFANAYGIRNLPKSQIDAMIAQWNALPNYINDGNILPLVDVSGSMTSIIDKSGLSALEVAVSLGLYCADKNTGDFKDTFLTFSSNPELLHLKGNIFDKINQMVKSTWHMSTDLHAAFNKILDTAKKYSVPREEMPKTLLILSDMQFNVCVRHDDSAIQMIRRKYEEAGYDFPNVVFWNINSYANVPVTVDTSGTALVSGFSPSILTAIMSNDMEDFTPRGVMMKAIMKDKYTV